MDENGPVWIIKTMKLFVFELGRIGGRLPIPGYLIQTDDDHNVLVDTGCRAMQKGLLQADESQTIVSQLRNLGLQPNDIDTVVLSHFDADHCGNLDAFPDAEIVVQCAALAFVRSSEDARFVSTREIWTAPDLQYREICGDIQLLPGIELVATAGHVPGHQSVLVNLPETGYVLLAIDAMPHEHSANPLVDRGPQDLDPEGAKASVRKLNALIDQKNVRLVIFGHDPNYWQEVHKSPQFYT
ncbi:MAG: N-acyl homoserine lactonase family protein [Proteobacteria bacterium]|nr:MAG: N-acyl homoserine lactonase family protein [Pseudomonadota bacterium]